MIRDELIEEGGRAIAEYQGVRYDSALKDTWDGMARAAFSVWARTLGVTPGIKECCDSCARAKKIGFTPSSIGRKEAD